VIRIRIVSVLPPKYPAARPIVPPIDHRDEGRGEADDERDRARPHQERDDVDAAVVEPERVAPRRMAEDRPDLLVQVVGREHRREQRAEDDQHEQHRPKIADGRA
jgi:hypothetical protein